MIVSKEFPGWRCCRPASIPLFFSFPLPPSLSLSLSLSPSLSLFLLWDVIAASIAPAEIRMLSRGLAAKVNLRGSLTRRIFRYQIAGAADGKKASKQVTFCLLNNDDNTKEEKGRQYPPSIRFNPPSPKKGQRVGCY